MAVILGAAASVLIALAIRPDDPTALDAVKNGGAAGSPPEVVELVDVPAGAPKVVREFLSVFGPELNWIAERDERSDFGLGEAPHSAAVPATEAFVAVRLSLWSRSANSGPWKAVQTINVYARSEAYVHVPSASQASELELWAYPLGDGLICVDLRYDPHVHGRKTVEQSVVQPAGKAVRLCDFEQDGVEYRLFQSATVLEPGDLG